VDEQRVEVRDLQGDVVHHAGWALAWVGFDELQPGRANTEERDALVVELDALGHVQSEDIAVKRDRSFQAFDV
jgi:hypothetical protein